MFNNRQHSSDNFLSSYAVSFKAHKKTFLQTTQQIIWHVASRQQRPTQHKTRLDHRFNTKQTEAATHFDNCYNDSHCSSLRYDKLIATSMWNKLLCFNTGCPALYMLKHLKSMLLKIKQTQAQRHSTTLHLFIWIWKSYWLLSIEECNVHWELRWIEILFPVFSSRFFSFMLDCSLVSVLWFWTLILSFKEWLSFKLWSKMVDYWDFQCKKYETLPFSNRQFDTKLYYKILSKRQDVTTLCPSTQACQKKSFLLYSIPPFYYFLFLRKL